MEPLSPRPVNIQMKGHPPKEKAIPDAAAQNAEKALKDKEHAPAPPEWVIQPPLRPGGSPEKFRSGKHLGKGGFAICHEGSLGIKKYAMKIVKAKMHQKKTEEKFRTELQIHAKLRHPSIVEFHRAFTFEESIYVILELCPNGSIMDMIRRRKCLSLPEVRRFTVQICGAVKYLHARNAIHRDLKMGNLFLDKNMNIKLGDFGLAAILITEEEYQGTYHAALSRRRTMCGTPNYIAPEILEKRKNGHDHKVDIWSIGVILFAMLTGYPPFQSTTQDEIYRRVKLVEYKWPKEEESMNDIPEEAKDLVARLLTISAEDRPDPDRIVGHPFFAMHGGNAIPAVVGSACRASKPTWLDPQSPRGDVMRKGSHRLPLTTLAKICGVGLLDGFTQAFETVGEKLDISLYKECLKEEIAKSYPIVPLPADMVYTGKPDENGCWNSNPRSLIRAAPKPTSPKLSRDALPEVDELQMILPETRTRPTIPSHASTLRAPPYTTLRSRDLSRSAAPPTTLHSQAVVSSKAGPGPLRSTRPNRGLLNELPVRSASNPSKAAGNEIEPRPSTRVTRSQSAHLLSASSASSVGPIGGANQPEPSCRGSDHGTNYRAPPQRKFRLASRAKETLSRTSDKSSKRATRPAEQGVALDNTKRTLMIGPDEVAECIPRTKAKDVVGTLRKLWAELDSAVKGDSNTTTTDDFSRYGRKKSPQFPPLITQWVDYSNKFGLGYILANGSVGCLFKGDSVIPTSYLVVAGSQKHFYQRQTDSYREKNQIVPQAGAPVEFLEDCEEGIKRVIVPAAKFPIKDGTTLLEKHLCPGETVYDLEKRKRLTVWNKFGNFMARQYGKDPDAVEDADPSSVEHQLRRRKLAIAGPFIKFFQRVGNVIIWVFGDGALQFNFPDHTKLLFSPDGSWLDFYYLPPSAAAATKMQMFRSGKNSNGGNGSHSSSSSSNDGGSDESSGSHPDWDTLNSRSLFSYPIAIIARGFFVDEQKNNEHVDFRDAIRFNQFHSKLTFIRYLVGSWIEAGGLGCLSPENRYLRWDWGEGQEGFVREGEGGKEEAGRDREREGKWEGKWEEGGVSKGSRSRLIWVTIGGAMRAGERGWEGRGGG